MTDVMFLVSTTTTTDAWGDTVMTETRRQVFCEYRSIGTHEFYQAQATGLKPEIKLVIADYLDYNGEHLVDYDGRRYRVLRTYRTGQELEITLYSEVSHVST